MALSAIPMVCDRTEASLYGASSFSSSAFCVTGPFSADHSRLGQNPGKAAKEESLGTRLSSLGFYFTSLVSMM